MGVQLGYSSLTLFYADLRAHLLESGMSVARELGLHDAVLSAGPGFLRLRRTVNGSVGALGVEVGKDIEALSASAVDPRLCMPFTLQAGASVAPVMFLTPTSLEFALAGDRFVPGPSVASSAARYRCRWVFETGESSVMHTDHWNPHFQPNFWREKAPLIAIGE